MSHVEMVMHMLGVAGLVVSALVVGWEFAQLRRDR